jgi:hypothetical protein
MLLVVLGEVAFTALSQAAVLIRLVPRLVESQVAFVRSQPPGGHHDEYSG